MIEQEEGTLISGDFTELSGVAYPGCCHFCEPWEGRGEWEITTIYDREYPEGKEYRFWHGEEKFCRRKAEGTLVEPEGNMVFQPHEERWRLCREHAQEIMAEKPTFYWLDDADEKELERMFLL